MSSPPLAVGCRRRTPLSATNTALPRARKCGVCCTQQLVGGVGVVLEEHRADRRDRERGADEEQPPAEDEAEEAGGGGETAPQRRPGVRREEPELTGPVTDVGVGEVLRTRLHPPGGEQQVRADERAQTGGERERG